MRGPDGGGSPQAGKISLPGQTVLSTVLKENLVDIVLIIKLFIPYHLFPLLKALLNWSTASFEFNTLLILYFAVKPCCYIAQSQDSDSGRIAAVPSGVLTELAARRAKSTSVADSSLAANLALLLWLTEAIEREDLQLLATQVDDNDIEHFVHFYV